jgi:hypothetical protein
MGVPPRDSYLEAVERTWGDIKRQHFPDYVFREDVEPVAYQIFVGEDSEIIHEACAKAPEDREFPLYADDIEAYRNSESIQCFMCYKQIADRKV